MGFSFFSFPRMHCLHGPASATVLALMATTAVPCLWAAEPVALIKGPSVVITTADIEADALLRIPEEMRSSVLSRVQSVQQMAGNLYVRRVMAEKAHALGLGTDEATQTALRLARDKVLSDAYLSYLDEAKAASKAAVEAQARSEYRAKPERFQAQEQVKVRHILLEGKSPETRKKAEELLQALRNGADFAELAQKNSIDKGSAAKGGELGFFARGRMAREFEDAAFELQKVGDLSGVVETQFGLHILQLQEQRTQGRLMPFDEVKNALETEIRSRMSNQARVTEAEAIKAEANPQTDAIEAFTSRYAEGESTAVLPKQAP